MASSLPPGIYRIETVPPPGALSAHAVGEIIDTPVLAIPDIIPGGVGEWRVSLVEGTTDQYTIMAHRHPMPPGWGYHGEADPGENVLYTLDIKNWRITRGDDDQYTIAVPNGIIGAIWAVAVRDEGVERNVLVIKSYPVIPDMPPLPTWRFIPVLLD